jgi:hypothetical protein
MRQAAAGNSSFSWAFVACDSDPDSDLLLHLWFPGAERTTPCVICRGFPLAAGSSIGVVSGLCMRRVTVHETVIRIVTELRTSRTPACLRCGTCRPDRSSAVSVG